MKKLIILSFIFLSATQIAKADVSVVVSVDTTDKQKVLVKVKSWGSRAIYLLGSNYFTETRDEIIEQIGLSKFEDVQSKCSSSGWPSAMYDGEGDEAVVDAKMNKLRMYQIAVYQHKYNGNVFEKTSILEVPYSENTEWDANVKWEGSIYFLINEKDVEAIKSE
ncbi:hypothetical protein ACQ33O_10400 [Ferruginibacter sp. SUN002]|uniref:hypothetical protein n=1 Tax=Ferruginibacter sp. SUN002 TaxID=2937789 RepID=UPI003D366A0E